MKSSIQSTSIYFKYFFIVFFILASCEKDKSADEDMTIDDPNDPNDDPNDDPNNSTGRFSDYISCSIISTPSAVSLNPTYTKYINCSGVPVVGSVNVSDEALIIASQTSEFMLTGIGSVRNKLITGGAYIILYEAGLTLNEIPESGGNQPPGAPAVYRYDMPNGINYLITPATNLLCDQGSGSSAGNIIIHELTHMIDGGALRQLDSNFAGTLATTYNNARSNGKWDNTYAATNKEEYFAEAVTIWFGSNWIGREGGDGFRNEIGSRAQLQNYDVDVYNLVNSHITSLTDVPGCREPVIEGATANCPSTIADIDGNVYEIVNIGPMCWMKENLRTTRYKDGTTIANVQNDADWENTSSGAWSHYNNDPNLDMYGKLYNGFAAANPAGLCPDGWHVPSIQELTDLTQYAGGDYASMALKETSSWTTQDGTNTSGFTALPAGNRLNTGFFVGMGSQTIIISKTLNTTQERYAKGVFDAQDYVGVIGTDPNSGSSCRCIRD